VLAQASSQMQWKSEVVATEVRVLAVGRSLTASRERLELTDGGTYAGSSTVTLELTTEQSLSLLEKSGAGSHPLTLLLHAPKSR
jgi:Flp pilus assembly protein CpaB